MTAINPVFPFLERKKNFTFPGKSTEKEEGDEDEGGERKRTMFYSQCLLSSKGPLGAIWVAGYFFRRLKKRQITDTDITSSVDKILLEGLPSVSYRILAYLLLGVVRIYSKKVEYLFQDCHEAVSDVNRFSVGKKVVPFRDIVRSSPSISLPERYELDSFQLEVADGASKCNIARNEDISIQVDAGKDVFSQYSLDKVCFEEVSSLWDDMCDAQTSHGVTMQQETYSSTQSPDKLAAEREISTCTHTPPDIVLSPHRMEIDGASSPDHIKNFKTSKEKLREFRFTEEDMDIDRIEFDVELLNLINDYQVQTTDNLDEDALKKAPLENQDYVISKEKEVPSSTEKTHDSEVANAGVTATPEFMVVPTPAKKEKIQRPCKRKCMYDETTMLDNEIMKQVIKEASGLVCKRRKAPHTVIDVWRFHRISALPKSFLEPLIPCVALDLEFVHYRVKTERTGTSTSQAVEPIETTQAPVKQQDAATPSARTDSRSTIAPGTPVQCPTSARVFGNFRGADSDGEGVQSYENRRKELSVHEEAEDSCGPSLMAVMDENEGDSQELHKNKNGGLSARSRTMARYLRRVIQRKKQKGVEAITLLPIVERKTRRENAMLFFEILALSSGGFINVVQEKAFGDVLLQETPQLEEILKKC